MLARGEFKHRVPVHGEDELAQLGRVFNDTARQLQDLYESLQSSEDRLRRVINTIPAHVWSTLPDGSVDFINQRLLESTGLSIEELCLDPVGNRSFIRTIVLDTSPSGDSALAAGEARRD